MPGGGAGLGDAAVLILTSLAAGPRHGYGIMQEVEAMCGVRLGPGTLYAALARLEREGRVEALQADSDRRRPYRLTPAGRTWLREELRRMDSVVRAGLPRVARDA